jgi:KDO2-lipid IV(A) lauroyltransferase
MTSESEELSLTRFWSPRYWPTWSLWLWLRLSVYLPYKWQITLGKRLGDVLRICLRRAPLAAQRNLEVCFPELSPSGRDRLVRQHFKSLGASVAEVALGWYAPIERLRPLVRVEGRENLQKAHAEGRGVILYAAHFTCLEIGLAILEDLVPSCRGMYRPHGNAMLDAMIRDGRRPAIEKLIPKDNIRSLVRELHNNATVVYLPDHTNVGSSSELLPFFGEPAVTNVATPKLAKLSGATVLAYFFRRLPDDSGYLLKIAPPLPNFPSESPSDDAQRLVGQLEEFIREAPEQYLWTYRKFKGRPSTFPNIYQADS